MELQKNALKAYKDSRQRIDTCDHRGRSCYSGGGWKNTGRWAGPALIVKVQAIGNVLTDPAIKDILAGCS